MTVLFKIAFRNILRNGRRSAMTAAAITIGAVALILFGEYEGMAVIGLETGAVESTGHLTIFQKGYSEFGSGQPDAYSIAGYERVLSLIKADRELQPMLAVVTPTVSLGGIAGNAATDRSKTFFGTGLVPSDWDKMRRWDEYRLYTTARYGRLALDDSDTSRGVVGKGLAHILGVRGEGARLELLSGARGAPNVVAFTVAAVESKGAKEVDDSYVGLNLKLAQQLLYGSGAKKVTAIVVQFQRSEDMARGRERLAALFAEHRLDLEMRDYAELSPVFGQITGALKTLFAFVSVILAIIVSFTIANTMGMSVMERVSEIGTARAMGLRRRAVGVQFLLEGALLGLIGAGVGAAIAAAVTIAINHAGITYHMPISASPIPLYLMDENVAGLRCAVAAALVAVAVTASLLPAARAARMKVVDALRHV